MAVINDLRQYFKDAHAKSDVDVSRTALHHTLGPGVNQAAPGNHTHEDLGGDSFDPTELEEAIAALADYDAGQDERLDDLEEVALDHDDRLDDLEAAAAPSPYFLDPATLHATYGDHFTSSSLDAKWTRVGYVSGDEQHQMGGGTWMQVDVAKGAGNYWWQTAPSGDYTIVMAYSVISVASMMFGPMMIDNSGNGVMSAPYSTSDGSYTLGITAVAYNSTAQAFNVPTYNPYASGIKVWAKLQKTASGYHSSFSLNGQVWRKTPGLYNTYGGTPTKIGFGSIYGTPNSVAIDFFDVQ
jgi:hypothetical protein